MKKQISWSLLNIKTLQKKSKKFYLSPSKESIFRQLKKGNYFQLMFRSNNQKTKFIAVEKLWCCYEKRKNGLYYGRLVNIPRVITTLQFGDEIAFCREHILACMSQEKAMEHFSLADQKRNCAQLQKLLLSNSEVSTQWIREMPTNREDTGWRLVGKNLPIDFSTKDFELFQLSKSLYWDKILKGSIGTCVDNRIIAKVGK